MSLVGFRFRPSVKELIDVLEIMARDGPRVVVSDLTESPGDISGKELYGEVGKEPWKILCNDNEWELYDLVDTGKKKATYVVTRLPKTGDNKVARKAGHGTWMGQTQPTVFEKHGEEVAFMKSLSYVYTGQNSEARDECYYYLHEYYLSKSHLEKIGAQFTDYVICRIIKDPSKSCRCGRNVKNSRRQVQDCASSSGAKKQEESYNTNVGLQTLVPPVNNFGEFTENPSSLFHQEHPVHNLGECNENPSPLFHQEHPVHNLDECNENPSSLFHQEHPVHNLDEVNENPSSQFRQEHSVYNLDEFNENPSSLFHQEHPVYNMDEFDENPGYMLDMGSDGMLDMHTPGYMELLMMQF